MCELLLNHGASFSFSDDGFIDGLDVALAEYFTDEIMHVITNHPDIADTDWTLAVIRRACMYHHDDFLMCMLEHGHKLNGNYRWWGDECPCGLVVCFNAHNCMDVLLRWGVFPDIKSRQCYDENYHFFDSVFDYAAECDSAQCMELLVEFNPYFLQDDWLVKCNHPKYDYLMNDPVCKPLTAEFQQVRMQPPCLTILCRAKIYRQLDFRPMDKVDKLNLPNLLKDFLKFTEKRRWWRY